MESIGQLYDKTIQNYYMMIYDKAMTCWKSCPNTNNNSGICRQCDKTKKMDSCTIHEQDQVTNNSLDLKHLKMAVILSRC